MEQTEPQQPGPAAAGIDLQAASSCGDLCPADCAEDEQEECGRGEEEADEADEPWERTPLHRPAAGALRPRQLQASGDGRPSSPAQQPGKGRKEKPRVPDGGWGWVVVLASFVISMIADGISFSFGLLYVEFLEEFGESNSKTSWIGSLFMSVPLLVGPLGSALVDRYGCRAMTIAGGLVSGFGFILSVFGSSVGMLLVTFGVVAGLGLGLCYVTCIVSIAYWFDKRRTFATGLAASGTGVGTFVYAPMTQFFITEYGWRGTVLLLAGTFFNMCACGAVMRDPDWWVAEQRRAARAAAAERASSGSSLAHGSSSSCSSAAAGSSSEAEALEEARRMLRSGRSPELVLAALTAAAATPAPAPGALRRGAATSLVCLPTFVRRNETVPLEVLEALSANRRLLPALLDAYPGLSPDRSLSHRGPLCASPAPAAAPPLPPLPPRPGPRRRDSAGGSPPPLPPRPALANGLANGTARGLGPAPGLNASFKRPVGGSVQPSYYLQGIRVHRNSVMYRGAALSTRRYRLRASSCPDILRNSVTTIAREEEEHWYSTLVVLVCGLTDLSLFAELHFLLMSLSTILLFICFIVPYFYLADHLEKHGYDKTAPSALLSIIGGTNTAGMVLLGWAGDQPWMNITKTYAWCLVACGITVVAMPICTDCYPALAVVSGLFGLFFASSFSFTPVILVQLVSLDKFTTAYGLILMCQGIGNLVGPPLGGLVGDLTNNWDLSFYMAGIWTVVSGVLIAFIPVTRNRRLWGKNKSDSEKNMEMELKV